MLPARTLHREVVQTLLYYDIWQYPLNAKESFAFLPVNSISFTEFEEHIHRPRILVIYDDDFNYLTKMCLSRFT